ncbi:MAG: F0F1 ATP synthase subunit delta [Alphaproteobacteria bacterium]|nr:F0F1 ATP synthase subunit delta [Alphaproteobacteria bacterium]
MPASQASAALSSRYAAALIALAHEAGQLDRVERDLDLLSSLIQHTPELAALILQPALRQGDQQKAMDIVGEKAGFHELTKGFVGTLIRNRRLYALGSVIRSIKDELSRRRGEMTAKVQTAHAMSSVQRRELEETLSKKLGHKVFIDAQVDPSLIGGMVVTIGSTMIDDSVRHKLEKLKAAMGKQANENVSVSSRKEEA